MGVKLVFELVEQEDPNKTITAARIVVLVSLMGILPS
jgi:hypothetical protein